MREEPWWPLLHCRVVAVLKRRKHKMEFKDCQSEQKGVTFVKKKKRTETLRRWLLVKV